MRQSRPISLTLLLNLAFYFAFCCLFLRHFYSGLVTFTHCPDDISRQYLKAAHKAGPRRLRQLDCVLGGLPVVDEHGVGVNDCFLGELAEKEGSKEQDESKAENSSRIIISRLFVSVFVYFCLLLSVFIYFCLFLSILSVSWDVNYIDLVCGVIH